jgi:ABC-type transport system substrate-binding protein
VVVLLAVLGMLSVKQAPTPGGSVVVDLYSHSTWINPLLASTDTDMAISHLLFPGLLQWNADGILSTDLASTWSVSDGGRAYTVTLQPGLKWQNGVQVRASDVVATYRLLISPSFPTHTDVWNGVTVKATSGRTIVFRLPRPDYTFASNLTTGIVPARFATHSTPVGAGPYAYAGVTRLAVNLKSAASEPNPSGLIAHVTFNTAPSAVQPTLGCRLTLKPITNTSLVPTTRELGLIVNARQISQKRVRQALLNALLQSHMAGLSTPSNPLPTWSTAARASPPSWADPRTLLRSAGWTLRNSGWHRLGKILSVDLVAGTSKAEVPYLHAIVHTWEGLGVNVTVTQDHFPDLVRTRLANGSFDAAIVDWDFGSPDYNPTELWGRHGALNFAHAGDRTLGSILAKIPTSPSLSRRDSLRQEAGNRLIRIGVAVGITPNYYACSVASGLHGYTPPALVTDAGGLVDGLPDWYVETRTVFHNPL